MTMKKTSLRRPSWGTFYTFEIWLFMIVNITPFAMSLTSILLLIFSPWKHLRIMQLSGKGPQDPSTKVHIKVMQTVISFLFLFAIYILALILSVWNSDELKKEPVRMLYGVLLIMYPSIHSCILIWGNRKLIQAFLSFLWQPRCWLKERK